MQRLLLSARVHRWVAGMAIMLALSVVMLGAYTRLTDAGLGCPDWPGCYGQLVMSSAKQTQKHAEQIYPDNPLEWGKAWTEMAHRYAAGLLGLCIVYLVFSAIAAHLKKTNNDSRPPLVLPFFLLALLFFQALLGMWTVTLKLLPLVVMGHLMGGMLIVSSLVYWRWSLSTVPTVVNSRWRLFVGLGCILVFFQIALGGWVSSNYAGIACMGFPTCNGQWWPRLYFFEGFNLFSSTQLNYQGGLLPQETRVSIQYIHRLGAYATAGYILFLAAYMLSQVQHKVLRRAIVASVMLVLSQFVLGIINVLLFLPLWAAVMHNGVAAFLLASMVSQYYLVSRNTNAR